MISRFIFINGRKTVQALEHIPDSCSLHSLFLLPTPPPSSQKVTLLNTTPFGKLSNQWSLRHSSCVRKQITNVKGWEVGSSMRQHNGTFLKKSSSLSFTQCPLFITEWVPLHAIPSLPSGTRAKSPMIPRETSKLSHSQGIFLIFLIPR